MEKKKKAYSPGGTGLEPVQDQPKLIGFETKFSLRQTPETIYLYITHF